MSINTIKYIYNINKTSSNSTPISSTLVLFGLVVIIAYLYYKMIMKDISYDWETKRCSPKYIFYSGFFNSPTGDPIKDTYTNFADCTNPTKTTEGGNNQFKVVFDTANTITNTANKIIEYSNEILNESDRIEEESKNNISFIREKTNILKTSMDLYYNYQLKLYTILKMYFERIFLILDTFTQYTTDIKLYDLSNKKYNLKLNNGNQLTPFINNILTSYTNIYNDELTSAANLFKKIKRDAGSNYHTADYTEVINKCNEAYNNYVKLINDIQTFDSQNESKLVEIDTVCRELNKQGISYNTIFPFLNIKLST